MAGYVFICIVTILLSVNSNSLAEENEILSDKVARGEVQSCRGCSLNRLPDVKLFIFSDLPKYNGVEFRPIHGAIPHLVLFDQSDKEVDRINLSSLTREECNELVGKWFSLKEESKSTETTASGKNLHGEL